MENKINYDDFKTELEGRNKNIQHAIQLRKIKDKKTDFYWKLQMLNDKIQIYTQLFHSRQPNFLTSAESSLN